MKNSFIGGIIDRIFDIGILTKSFFGFFEVFTGIVLAISGKLAVSNLIIALTQQEISEDSNDVIANYLIKTANNFSAGSHIFAVVYLLFHGVVNIFLAIALLKNKLWAYPWAISGFSFFIIYQVYRYSYTHSFLLLFLTLFDIFVISVILLEYRKNYTKKQKIHLK